MEQIIKMNLLFESIMASFIIVVNMILVFLVMLVSLFLAFKGSFPDSIEDEFAFTDADLSTFYKIALLLVL